MNYRFLNALAAAGIVVGSATPALAVPTLYPRPGNRLTEVSNTTTSTVVSDSGDANKLWVLPPQTGSVGISGVSYSANIGFCEEVSELQATSLLIVRRMNDIVEEIAATKPEQDALRQQKAALDLQAAALFENTFIQEIDDTENQIFDTEGRIDQLRLDIESCTTPECEQDIRDELDTLRDLKRELQTHLSQLRSQHREDYRAYTRLKNQVEAVQRAIDDLLDQGLARSSLLAQYKAQIFTMYKQYAEIEGAFANIAFESGWQGNVSALQSSNSSFSVSQIPTSDVRAYVALVPGIGSDSYLSQLPAVLAYTVNGQEVDQQNTEQALPSLPSAFTANARLSVIGACPIAHPDMFDLPSDASGSPLFGLSATYAYPTAFRTHVKATFNIWKVYEHMKRVTEDGGFFSSSTSVEETESSDGDSGMTFEFFDESGMSSWERDEIKAQIKLELMQDVLRLMGVPVPSQGAGLDPLPPPPNGAVVLANGIQSTCGWFSYFCGGASWILRGLSAIFGSSESEASFRTSYDYTATREYNTDATYNRSAMLTFTNE